MRGVKTKNSGRFKQVGLSVLLFILFSVTLNSAYGVYEKKRDAELALNKMQQDLVELEERETFLTESLGELSTEEGLKFEIKKKFNVAQVGESVALIVDDTNTTTTPNTSLSSWQKFKSFFKNLFD